MQSQPLVLTLLVIYRHIGTLFLVMLCFACQSGARSTSTDILDEDSGCCDDHDEEGSEGDSALALVSDGGGFSSNTDAGEVSKVGDAGIAIDAGVPEQPTYVPDAPWDCTPPVHIPDRGLEQTIRAALGKPKEDIDQKDMDSLTQLIEQSYVVCEEDEFEPDCHSDYYRILDLNGIQCFPNVEYLTIRLGDKNKPGIFVNLAPISYLRNLKALDIYMVLSIRWSPFQ